MGDLSRERLMPVPDGFAPSLDSKPMLTGRRLLTIAAVAALTGCAQAPSQRLTATEHPIEAVRVYAWGAGDTAVAPPGAQRFVETMNRNGLSVAGFVALDRALPDLAALERAWNSAPRSPRASHALVLTRQRLDTFGAAQYIRYEAVLWDAASRRLVWQSKVASLVNVLGRNTEQRAETLAADALRGLARDGFMTLHAQGPRDAAGSEIPPTLVPLQIR